MHTAFQLINHRTSYVSFRECHLSGRPWLLTPSQTTASLHGTVHMHDLCTQWAGSYTVQKAEQFVTLVTISWGGTHPYIRTTQLPLHTFSSHRTYLAQVSFPQDGRNGLGSQRRAEGSPHQHDASKKTLEERGGGGGGGFITSMILYRFARS